MPGLIMERPKMSLQMHETLKKYILRERKKKKEEDVAQEQKLREEMRKAEMTTQTLEQTKDQIKQLEAKLEELQQKKRDLFNQLKKVLNEESNLKKRPEQMLFQPSPYPHAVFNPLKFLPQTTNRVTLFKPDQILQPQAIKRQRSPSPPQIPTNVIPPQSIPIVPVSSANAATIFQSPPHQNMTASTNPNAIAGLSPVANTTSVFQQHVFSPNKKTRPSTQTPNLASINAYSPLIVAPQPQRLPAPYPTPPPQAQQSAFYPFLPNVGFQQHQHQQQQQQHQKPPMLGVSNSPVHPQSPYVLPTRLAQPPPGLALQSQLDAQKILYQSPQLLMSNHQSGGILAGSPLQRTSQPPPPPPPFN